MTTDAWMQRSNRSTDQGSQKCVGKKAREYKCSRVKVCRGLKEVHVWHKNKKKSFRSWNRGETAYYRTGEKRGRVEARMEKNRKQRVEKEGERERWMDGY